MQDPSKKESDIIKRIFEPLTHIGHSKAQNLPLRSDVHFAKRMRKPLTFGLTDDCASITPPDNKEMVVTKDMLVEGVHFIGSENPKDIAKKALRVNLSDIASGGAAPFAYMLGLSLGPDQDPLWLETFARGLKKDQEKYEITLLGGDLVKTNAPLMISVTLLGFCDPGAYVTRSEAQIGDYIYLTGTLGDAYIGLNLAMNMAGLETDQAGSWISDIKPDEAEYLINRYHLPKPRTSIAPEIAQFCTSAIDISDGLGSDLTSLCAASHKGADIFLAHLPLSKPVHDLYQGHSDLMEKLICGGDDYEILCTVPEKIAAHFETACKSKNTQVTHIGHITEKNVRFLGDGGIEMKLSSLGYDHL